MNLTDHIKAKAKELGFYACNVAEAAELKFDSQRLEAWLSQNRHGEMKYMENHYGKRIDPRKLLENAKSVLVCLYNYAPGNTLELEDNFKISNYAYGTDYHFVLKSKLKELIKVIQEARPESFSRAFVDSAPVLERAWASKAGLGWIGKNTCLITKEQGSYFFIGEVITDIPLAYDKDEVPNHCGGCTRCLDACPTGALDSQGLDSRKCISYLTIEYRGKNLPPGSRNQFKNWIYGCDICQEVCPWNRLSEPHQEAAFVPNKRLLSLRKKDWHSLSEEDFNEIFMKSAVKRTKYTGLKRNIQHLSGPEDE